MNTKLRSLFVLAFILLFAGCSHAGDVDAVLAQAQKEGKAVMLELGSVGCIPCEQMKTVMEKLRLTYAGKLEVIFIDVRQDNKTARRFGVHVIPTQVFLDKQGKEFHRHIGFYPYEEISSVLKKAVL